MKGTTFMRILLTFFVLFFTGLTSYAAEINIYSHRQSFLIQPVLDQFTSASGIKTNVIYAPKGGLLQRMIAEGQHSPADVILTSDISDMILYAENNLIKPHNSQTIKNNIPAHLRDDKTGWFAVSKRARILALSAERLPKDLTLDLEDLAKAEWHGRVCTRPGSHPYNRALMASVIAAHGEAGAESWGRGLVKNLARKPQGNDRAQAKAIQQGLCDIAIMNSYYYGKMKFSDKAEQKIWATAIRLSFTNQQGRGNHINVSAAALSHSAPNKQAAVRFLEFLSDNEAQATYAEVNFEYPANPAVPPSEEVASWGSFKEDALPLRRIAELSRQAQEIINRIAW